MDLISIIVPCYNEEDALPYFYTEIASLAAKMDNAEFEILLIDDGSTDKTLELMRNLHEKDSRIKYISFSRNFGKEAAMLAGLENAKGDFVAVMDADLQDPPALLTEMYAALKNEDFDCVATKRRTRKGEPVIRSLFSKAFYSLINKISSTEIVDGARDFRLMKRNMVDAIIKMREVNRFSKGIFSWVGFKTKWIAYDNIERIKGTTKWSFWKLFGYSIEGITAFSTAPLILSSVLGLLFCLVAFIGIIAIVIRYIVGVESAFGWPSMMVIMLFLSGVQLFSVGVLGQYMSKTYLEAKNRPVYISREEKL